MPNEMTEMM